MSLRLSPTLALAVLLAGSSLAWSGDGPPPPDVRPEGAGGNPAGVAPSLPDPWGNYAFDSNASSLPDPAVVPLAEPPEMLAEPPYNCLNPDAFCGTGYGWQWFGARVVNGQITFRAWSNLFAQPVCPVTFRFDFGDGTGALAPGTSTSSSSYVSVTHRYAQAGSYTVSITASTVVDGTEFTKSCVMTTINVVSCWQDGVLCYQGAGLVWNRSGTTGRLDIDPPVSVNQTLFASGATRNDYTYSATGTLLGSVFVPSGKLYVPGATGNVELFGQAPAFDVAWTTGDFHPLPGSPAYFDFRPGGLPLAAAGVPLKVGASSVTMEPTSILGVPGLVELARFSTKTRLSRGEDPEIVEAKLLSGSITPSITFVDVTAAYKPPPQEELKLKMGARFPFAGAASFSSEYRFASCGLNLADVYVGGVVDKIPVAAVGPVALGITGFRGALDHICDSQNLLISVGGRLGVSVAGVPIPGEFFRIDNVGLAYQHPLNFEVRAGTAQVLGYPVADVRGFLRGNAPLHGLTLSGTMNVADAVVGRASLLFSINRSWISGSVVGVVRIPDFACGFYNEPCKAIRAFARQTLGSLPYELNGLAVHVDGNVSQQTLRWMGNFVCDYQIGSLRLVQVVQVLDGSPSILVGTNMGDLYQILGAPEPLTATALAVERAVTVPAGLPGILFAATGKDGVPPALTLRAPDGTVLTREAPGTARFLSSDVDQTALFEVPSPAAGSWTLAADGLPASDVALFALAPKTTPRLTFTRVELAGTSVRIEGTVEPPSSTASVQLFFSTLAAAETGEPIGDALSAASGTLASTWDVASLPPGRYHVFARVSESGGLPATVHASTPVTIGGASALDAPKDLAGTRAGDTASLTWTPAAAPGAVVHNVLYTDQPAAEGYPYAFSATRAGQAVITGLDPASGYRFAVVAADDKGAYGPESNTLVLSGGASAGPIWVPASAHAAGAAGTVWRTDLEVHNPGPGAVTFSIDLLERGVANPSPRSRSFQLGPGVAVRYGDVLDTVFGFTGAAALRVTPASGRLLVTSRTYNLTPSGTFGQFVPGLPESEAFSSGEEARLIQLRQDPTLTDGFRTNLGVVNLGASPLPLDVRLRDDAGADRGQIALTLAPYEFRQLDRVLGSLEDGYVVVATPAAGGRFLAFATVVDNRTGDPICVVPERRQTASPGAPVVRWIPASAHAAGAGGAVWRTDAELHNGGATTARVTLELLPRGGANPSPVSRVLDVAAGACLGLDDILMSAFDFNGAAAIRATAVGGDLHVTSRTFNLQPSGTFGQFVPGLSEARAVPAGGEGRLIQLSHDPSLTAGFRTNLGLVNATAAEAEVEVRLFRSDGTLLGTLGYRLRPYEFLQEDRVFERASAAAVNDGYAVVRVASGSVFAFATVIDNRTGDPVFLPALQ